MDDHQRAHQSSLELEVQLSRNVQALADTMERLTAHVERLTERVIALENGESH